MRPISLATASLVAVTLLLAPAAAAARPTRCAKGSAALTLRGRQRLCVPRRAATSPVALIPLARLAKRTPARPSKRLQREALKALSWARSREKAGGARAASVGPRARTAIEVGHTIPFGVVTAVRAGADGTERIYVRGENGLEHVVTARGEMDVIDVESRMRDGRSLTMGMRQSPKAPTCPAADGDVPAVVDEQIIVGFGTTVHGKRTWVRIEMRIEGRWLGHVGVGARAERYDLDVRGVTEVRSGVEIASTEKVLKRDPTRTYRTVLRKRGVPLGAPWSAYSDAIQMRGPKGTRISESEVRVATETAGKTFAVGDDATDELRRGDRRWYDERRCATVEQTHTPERVSKGGRGEWDVTAYAADDAVVADARWAPASSCGALTASGTTGGRIHLTVADDAGAWGPDTGEGACATAELTTTAGRPRTFSHEIPPEERRRLKVDVTVSYSKEMGPTIAGTRMTGRGAILLTGTPGELAEGTGQYSGTEWDGTPENSCGRNMLRERGFSERAAVGAQLNDDGTLTVAFTAPERAFEMAWIVIVPVTGGSQRFQGTQPFCGEPRLGKTESLVTVNVTELPAA